MLTAVLAVGLSQAGGGDEQEATSRPPPFDLEAALTQLEGAPEPLAGLHEQSSELLDGGVPAFEARLKELRGTPVVINKWASWCGPCRAEFPVFQRVATERGKEIAFLGSNSGDSTDAGARVPRRVSDPVPVLPRPGREDRAGARGAGQLPDHGLRRRAREDRVHPPGPVRDRPGPDADIDRYLGT